MKKSAEADGFMYRNYRSLGSRFRQSSDGTGRKAKLHAADAFGLEIDRKRAACVALGVADLVTGLGSPAGKLADAAHIKNRIKNDELRI